MGNNFKIMMVLLSLSLGACAKPSMFETTYRMKEGPIDASSAYLLDEGADPRLIFTEDFESDLKLFTDQNFIIVGENFFSGPEQNPADAVALGKTLGVTHILIMAEHVYDGRKKAYKYYDHYDYIPVWRYRYGQYYQSYDPVRSHRSVAYTKKIPIFRQHVVYLAKKR